MAPPIPGLSQPVAARRRSAGDVVAGVLAVAALAILIVGVPVALITVLGLPIPHSKPTVGLLTHQLSILSLIQILSVIVWLAWLQLVCCVAVEVRAAIRNVGVPIRIPLSGGTQAMAHRLVTAALLLFTATATLSPALAGSGYAHPAHTVSAEHEPRGSIQAVLTSQDTDGPGTAESIGAGAAASARAAPASGAAADAPQGEKIYVVRPPRGRFHESLWEIAENHLGNGLRYREIFEMNKDRRQPDGDRLTMAALIRPGWILRMPRDAHGPGIRIRTPGTPGGAAGAAEQAGASQAERAGEAATGAAQTGPSSPSPSSPASSSVGPSSSTSTSPAPARSTPTTPAPASSSPAPSSSGPSGAEGAAASQAQRATPPPSPHASTPSPSPRASTSRPGPHPPHPSTSSPAPGVHGSSSSAPAAGAGDPNAAERAAANQAEQATPEPSPHPGTSRPAPQPSTSSPASGAHPSTSPAPSTRPTSSESAGPPPVAAAGSPNAAERAAANQADQAAPGPSVPGAVPPPSASRSPSGPPPVAAGAGSPNAAERAAANQAAQAAPGPSVPGAVPPSPSGSPAASGPASQGSASQGSASQGSASSGGGSSSAAPPSGAGGSAGGSGRAAGSPDAAERAAASQARQAGQAAAGTYTPRSGRASGTPAPASGPASMTPAPGSQAATGAQGPVPAVPGGAAGTPAAEVRTASAGPHVFPHELAASSLLAAGLLTALGRRKREQLWQRAYGSTVAMPEGAAATAESALRLGANPSAVRVLDTGLRSLSQELAAAGKIPPTVFAAHIGQVNLDLWIAEADRNPPRPWEAVDDGQVWRLPLSTAAALDTGDAGAALAPYPGLVSIGTSDTGRMLVDLEVAHGLVAVRGPLNRVQPVLAAIAVELATNRWSDRMRITLVGFSPGLAALAPERITVAATLDAAMPVLESRAAEVSRALAAQQSYADGPACGPENSVLAGRSRDVQPGGWAPHYLISAIPPTPQQRERLLTLASTRHRTAMGYVVAGDVPGAAWCWDVTEPGRLRADMFGFDLRAQMLPPQQCAAVVDLFRTGGQPGGAALPAPPPDAVPAGQLVPGSRMSVEVSLLGQVAVQAPGGIEPARIGAATEIVAYLAAHPEGVPPDALSHAIWPRGVAPEVQNAALARVRDWLGVDLAGQPNLVTDPAGRLRLGPQVRVDWQVFRSLVGHAVQARQAAGQYPSARQDEAAYLTRALDLIHGQLLGGHDPRSYSWLAADPLEYQATAQVADVAHRLCELRLAVGDCRGAMDAARSGLRIAFDDEMLWRDLLTAAHATGEEHVLRGVVGELSARVSLDEVLPQMAPQTEALIDELLPSWRSPVA